jgi:hypothetical protein
MRSELFLDFTQCRLVVCYQRLGQRISLILKGLKKGPLSCPEMLITNYQSMLQRIRKELRSHLHRGRSLKSHKKDEMVRTYIFHGEKSKYIQNFFFTA